MWTLAAAQADTALMPFHDFGADPKAESSVDNSLGCENASNSLARDPGLMPHPVSATVRMIPVRPELHSVPLRLRMAQAEAALQQYERLAVANRYAGAVMHEVNNPLAAITNLVFLTKLHSVDRVKVLEYMSVIEDQPATSQRSRIKFWLSIENNTPRSVFGSELPQVLSNLLLNSLDALPERNAQLRIRVRTVRGAVHITVSDNGVGMTPDVRKTLLQPDKTTKETRTGLGVWLSKRIVDKHNGKLRVRSSQASGRRGTTIRLSIPLMFAT